jgi:hypothetical protein
MTIADAADGTHWARRTRAKVHADRTQRQAERVQHVAGLVRLSNSGEPVATKNGDGEANGDGNATADDASKAADGGDDTRAEEAAEAAAQDGADDDGERLNGSRTRPVPYVIGDGDVRVAPPDPYHADWDAWDEYHEVYCKATMQVLPIKEMQSWKEKDRRIRNTIAFKEGRARLLPKEWNPFQRTYICTHGWPTRSRGTGKRPRQHIRTEDCPFRFIVQACPLRRKDAKSRMAALYTTMRSRQTRGVHCPAIVASQIPSWVQNWTAC